MAIPTTESIKARVRPTRSAIRPRSTPPIGRTRKPAAKAPKAEIKDVLGSAEGKKLLPIGRTK